MTPTLSIETPPSLRSPGREVHAIDQAGGAEPCSPTGLAQSEQDRRNDEAFSTAYTYFLGEMGVTEDLGEHGDRVAAAARALAPLLTKYRVLLDAAPARESGQPEAVSPPHTAGEGNTTPPEAQPAGTITETNTAGGSVSDTTSRQPSRGEQTPEPSPAAIAEQPAAREYQVPGIGQRPIYEKIRARIWGNPVLGALYTGAVYGMDIAEVVYSTGHSSSES